MGGVKIEAPRGWGVGSGCPPTHWERRVERGVLGRGVCPLPRKIWHFFASKSHVCDAL